MRRLSERPVGAWIAAVSLVFAGVTRAQESDVAAGERLFRLHCAECHGLDGQGGQGPDLTLGVYRHGSTDEAIFRTISGGVPGTPMPATSLSDPALRQIVRHVRRLGGGVRVKTPGDAAAGQKLFSGKGGCGNCHMIAGSGGRLGPDLTHIGSLRSPAHLRSSILRPDEEVSPSYWSVEATDHQGKPYAGIRMNEDSYTIQIMDETENLHSLFKQDLRAFTVFPNKSRMPAYEKIFTPAELDDLVAYLYSLHRNTRQP